MTTVCKILYMCLHQIVTDVRRKEEEEEEEEKTTYMLHIVSHTQHVML